MATEPGVLISKPLALDLQALNRECRRSPVPPPRPRPTRDLSQRPPIRAILLEDLVSDGSAECAVTEQVQSSELQEVELVGDPISGGTFTLQFKGQTTTPLNFNATADEMQSALEALSTIGKNNVSVSLGKGSYATDEDPESATTKFPGVWLVQFQGALAGQANLPLLVPADSLQGLAIVVAETTHWADTGIVETANDIIPVGVPTPMRAGAVVACVWFPGVGYGVLACECREFSVTYY